MRILIVSAYGDDERHGGAERTIALLSRELSARGAEIDFLRAFPGGGTVGTDTTTVLHSVDWKESTTRRVLNHANDLVSRPSRRLTEAVARHRPDVVHSHSLVGIGTGIWEVARRAGIPVVHTLHDYHLLCPRVTLVKRDGRPCEPSPLLCGTRSRRLTRYGSAVSHVLGCSRYVLDVHADLFPGAEQDMAQNPVVALEVGALRAPARRPRSVGYIGGLDVIKGVGVLLDAASELGRLGLEVHIAGEGRMRDAVADAADRFAGVHYHGHVSGSAKIEFFEACDIGIVPSVWAEPGAPNYTMLEWLSAGRPVIASRRGGLGEVVDETPGAVAIEPTSAQVVAALTALLEPDAWSALTSAVRPGRTTTVGEYADIHERVYGSLAT